MPFPTRGWLLASRDLRDSDGETARYCEEIVDMCRTGERPSATRIGTLGSGGGGWK